MILRDLPGTPTAPSSAASQSMKRTRPDLRAAHEAATRSSSLREAGYRVKPWHAGPRTPGSIRINGFWAHDPDLTRGWLDHQYKLLTPDGAHDLSSPSPITSTRTVLARLAQLQGAGWSVSIDAARALWYPGRTVAVWIRKGGASWSTDTTQTRGRVCRTT